MKKLVFMLAAICAAVAVQAAYVDWQYEGKNAKNDTSWGGVTAGDSTGYTAYLLTEAAYNGLGDKWSKSELASAASDSSSLVYEKTTKSVMYYTTHPDSSLATGVRQVSGTSGNYYIIIGNDTDFAIAVGPTAITAYDDPTAVGTGKTPGIALNGADNTALSFSSYPGGGTDPTPEPTSGLLLLVGGAMLALRRKQK